MPTSRWLREQYLVRRRSAGRIAADCGWSSQYVRDRLREHGIALRPAGSTNPSGVVLDEATLTGLLGQGLSVAQIAARTGYSRAGAYQGLRRARLSVPAPAAREDPALLAELGRLYQQGRSLGEIGAVFGRGPDWVKARLRTAGVAPRSSAQQRARAGVDHDRTPPTRSEALPTVSNATNAPRGTARRPP